MLPLPEPTVVVVVCSTLRLRGDTITGELTILTFGLEGGGGGGSSEWVGVPGQLFWWSTLIRSSIVSSLFDITRRVSETLPKVSSIELTGQAAAVAVGVVAAGVLLDDSDTKCGGVALNFTLELCIPNCSCCDCHNYFSVGLGFEFKLVVSVVNFQFLVVIQGHYGCSESVLAAV